MEKPIRNIRIIPESECCGCAACANACPTGAIHMAEGRDGFIFPQVDLQRCVSCGKCVSTCPVHEVRKPNRKHPKCRAAYASDELRMESSSGAIFTLLADYVFKRGGAVYGVALNEKFEAEHRRITSAAELPQLRRSKYVQSKVGLSYRHVKQDLDDGKTVLFSGTPCQNAGLRKYLRGAEYTNLISADILCRGVASQSVFNEYLHEKFPEGNLKEFYFRIKDVGHNCKTCMAVTDDGNRIITDISRDTFEKGYHNSMFFRECCTRCPFAELPRQGDFTLGDFWGLQEYNPSYADPLGVSLVLLNNRNADRIWKEIAADLKFDKSVPLKFALNHNRFRSVIAIRSNREKFFRLRGQAPLSEVVDAALDGSLFEPPPNASIWRTITCAVKRMLPRPLKETAKKLLFKQ